MSKGHLTNEEGREYFMDALDEARAALAACEAERDKWKADAERLAAALRDCDSTKFRDPDIRKRVMARRRAALAAHEERDD